MATVTTRLPALVDYLVALFAADPTIGTATPPVTVYDGPNVTGLDPFLKLYIGLTDPDNTTTPEAAGESVQTWGALGRRGRNETVTIRCCAEAWSGYDSTPVALTPSASGIQTVRLAAYGIVTAVETLMQADTTQFGGNVLYPAPGVTNQALLQNSTTAGVIARVTFDLVFMSRIGG
jgi:hypothetical protein